MILHGDCIQRLQELDNNSVDSVITDPPYGLSFMGNAWDYDVPDVNVWKQCLRVLKPGGHLLAFFGSRTYHRGVIPIEDAGFEIRDQIMWLYGSGFPKGLNISKAIDKLSDAKREVIGVQKNAMSGWRMDGKTKHVDRDITLPATVEAKQWDGWGTALKPGHEPIVVARKPFKGSTVSNVLKFKTGALNIDECRVGNTGGTQDIAKTDGANKPNEVFGVYGSTATHKLDRGRWPANVIHDGINERWGDFFYCVKANRKDRNEGLHKLEDKQKPGVEGTAYMGMTSEGRKQTAKNTHPTVKPTDLMRYLCRLVTPPNGTVLDPFMGSGSTGKAAKLENFEFIGIERESEYFEIAQARINAHN